MFTLGRHTCEKHESAISFTLSETPSCRNLLAQPLLSCDKFWRHEVKLVTRKRFLEFFLVEIFVQAADPDLND